MLSQTARHAEGPTKELRSSDPPAGIAGPLENRTRRSKAERLELTRGALRDGSEAVADKKPSGR